MATINFDYLQKGSGGSDVRRLQEVLNGKGYNLTVDGMFGDKTLAAVKDFQKKSGLAVDGLVGTKTWAALNGTTSGATGGGSTSGSSSTSSSSNTNTLSSGFVNSTYKPSDTVTSLKNAYDTHMAQKPTGQTFEWQTQLTDTINKILNREKFNYNFNEDALYQQYKDKFIQQGKMAMQDTMGQASAMTGGYGNSYAQSVGQQAYQSHLNELNDVIPELYQMAYDRYAQEGQDLYNQYAMLGDLENQNYNRNQDAYNNWLTEGNILADRYDTERNFDYGMFADDRTLKYDDYIWKKEFDEAKAQWDAEYKLSEQQSNALYGSGSSTGGSTGGNSTNGGNTNNTGGWYDNGSLRESQIIELQKKIGVTADGKWGKDSMAKANGMSADEAYKYYIGHAITTNLMDFSREEYEKNVKANGGSFYGSALADLREMKSLGKSNKEVQTYLAELVANSYITGSEYTTLYNKYRDNKL